VKPRVLVVEDSSLSRDALVLALGGAGFDAVPAANGAEALAYLSDGHRVDVILLDLMMPVMDGWTLIRRLRDENVAPGVPVVVFSADRDGRQKPFDVDGALRKPFELEELQEMVERLLRPRPAA